MDEVFDLVFGDFAFGSSRVVETFPSEEDDDVDATMGNFFDNFFC